MKRTELPRTNRPLQANQLTAERISGRFLVLPESNMEYWRPSWFGKETVIRILPAVYKNETSGERVLYPYRYSFNQWDFGEWVREYTAVKNFGINYDINMVIEEKNDSSGITDITMSPAYVIYRELRDACRNGTAEKEWYPLIMGVQGGRKAVKKPAVITLVQGLIYMHNDRMFANSKNGFVPRGLADSDPGILFEIPGSASRKLFGLCEELKEDSSRYMDPKKIDEDEDIFEKVYKYGDLVSIKHGRFVHFIQAGVDPRARFGKTGQHNYGHGGQQQQEDDAFPKYDVFLTKTFLGYPDDNGLPADLTKYSDTVVKKWKPWDQVVAKFTYEEQAHILARNLPPSAVMYAFRDRPHWIPDDVRAASVNRVSAQSNWPRSHTPGHPMHDPFQYNQFNNQFMPGPNIPSRFPRENLDDSMIPPPPPGFPSSRNFGTNKHDIDESVPNLDD